MSDQAHIQEYTDWRQTLLARNANAVMASLEEQRRRNDQLESNVNKQNNKIATLEVELRALTQRFNLFFVEAQGHGATEPSDEG